MGVGSTSRLSTASGNCDPAVIRHHADTSRDARIVFGFWSGARDLNPGPHGPEPCRRRVLGCPGGSAGALLISNAASLLSSRNLLVPPGSANA
jgi:hypothetical protein